jgi:hypothetical protein
MGVFRARRTSAVSALKVYRPSAFRSISSVGRRGRRIACFIRSLLPNGERASGATPNSLEQSLASGSQILRAARNMAGLPLVDEALR